MIKWGVLFILSFYHFYNYIQLPIHLPALMWYLPIFTGKKKQNQRENPKHPQNKLQRNRNNHTERQKQVRLLRQLPSVITSKISHIDHYILFLLPMYPAMGGTDQLFGSVGGGGGPSYRKMDPMESKVLSKWGSKRRLKKRGQQHRKYI